MNFSFKEIVFKFEVQIFQLCPLPSGKIQIFYYQPASGVPVKDKVYLQLLDKHLDHDKFNVTQVDFIYRHPNIAITLSKDGVLNKLGRSDCLCGRWGLLTKCDKAYNNNRQPLWAFCHGLQEWE